MGGLLDIGGLFYNSGSFASRAPRMRRSDGSTRVQGRLQDMASAPIILVPGFWLGAWAWDEVAGILRKDGHDVTAITLPGQGSADEDRSGVTFEDHVKAITDAVEAAGAPVVLAVHSASGFSGYAASDRIPDRIAAMVYVDTAPGKPPLDADQEGDKPMVWDELAAEENLDGMSEEQKATFRERAVPVPGGVVRGEYEFTNDARRDIPSTVIATGYTAEAYQKYAKEHPVPAFLAGLPELRNVSWVDLPTSHWPMWSKPAETAKIIGDVATAVGGDR
jgi:pimeloyl-ACP methyl ester carboxylesterase